MKREKRIGVCEMELLDFREIDSPKIRWSKQREFNVWMIPDEQGITKGNVEK